VHLLGAVLRQGLAGGILADAVPGTWAMRGSTLRGASCEPSTRASKSSVERPALWPLRKMAWWQSSACARNRSACTAPLPLRSISGRAAVSTLSGSIWMIAMLREA